MRGPAEITQSNLAILWKQLIITLLEVLTFYGTAPDKQPKDQQIYWWTLNPVPRLSRPGPSPHVFFQYHYIWSSKQNSRDTIPKMVCKPIESRPKYQFFQHAEIKNWNYLSLSTNRFFFEKVLTKTLPKHWDSKAPSIGILLAYVETTLLNYIFFRNKTIFF